MTQKHVEWFWKSNDNPFLNTEIPEWSRYSDIESIIIEDAFMTLKKPVVILDDYHIDFEHRVQIANDEKGKQRPVKRVEMNKEDARLREARFMPNPIAPSSSFHGLVGLRKIFIDSFMEHFNIKSVNDWEKQKHEIVEKAILGILHEGQIAGKQSEAKWINQQLEKRTSKTVYRGAQLTDEMIADYKRVAQSNDSRRSFQAFTSCSRNRAKAEQFGNVLFVLNVEHRTSYRTLNMDISILSAYPDEEEVLIRPGRAFKIHSVEFDKTKNKHIIYLIAISTSDQN